jgi:uncharacterized protein (DUF1697 family)
VPARIAFLRGINVGGNRGVSMADLRGAFETGGYERVRTHLQSGNVLFDSKATAARLEPALRSLLRVELGLDAHVLVRTRAELAAIVRRNPLAKVADNGSRHLVTFLAAKPAAKAVRELTAAVAAPELVEVHGREIYSWHPRGLADSDVVKRLLTERRLGVVSTGRNWNTVTKMLELAEELDQAGK